MWEIMAEWSDGSVETIDEAESEVEARQLVREYRMAYHQAKRIWHQQPKRRH